MVGMGMRIDNQFKPHPMVREDAQVAVDALPHRIDQHAASGLLAGQQVGLATAAIEFKKQHLRAPGESYFGLLFLPDAAGSLFLMAIGGQAAGADAAGLLLNTRSEIY